MRDPRTKKTSTEFKPRRDSERLASRRSSTDWQTALTSFLNNCTGLIILVRQLAEDELKKKQSTYNDFGQDLPHPPANDDVPF